MIRNPANNAVSIKEATLGDTGEYLLQCRLSTQEQMLWQKPHCDNRDSNTRACLSLTQLRCWLLKVGWGLRIYISDKFPGGPDALRSSLLIFKDMLVISHNKKIGSRWFLVHSLRSLRAKSLYFTLQYLWVLAACPLSGPLVAMGGLTRLQELHLYTI